MRTITLDEFVDLFPDRVSSEERLEKLGPECWSPRLFSQKATELQDNAKLEVRVVDDASQLPELGSEREFRYDYCSYAACLKRQQAGEKLFVPLALKDGQVVGYAITALIPDGSGEIEILEVAESSRRESGLKVDLIVQNETFSVGVAHVLVVELLRTFHGEVRVDATNSPSRYVFKSLGFAELPGETNPCLLHKLPASRD
jgi:hypothetical protein